MRDLKRIEGYPDLVKDMDTGMILNINKEKIDKVKAIRAEKQKQQQEIDGLKSDVSDIKNMLQMLLDKGSKE